MGVCGGSAIAHSWVLAIMHLPFLEEGEHTGFMGTLECKRVAWELCFSWQCWRNPSETVLVGLVVESLFLSDTIGMAK